MPGEIQHSATPPLAELILHNPERRNALSVEMWAAIPDRIAELSATEGVRAILVHGGETGVFAAGADISEFGQVYDGRDRSRETGRTIARALDAIEACRQPVIAAIEGDCVGGGVSIAMACDLRSASRTARFGVTPARLGLVYPPGDTQRLMEAVGLSKAKDLLFTGRLISAVDALDMGLVDRIVPEGDAISAARDWAGQIAAMSPSAVQGMKQMMRGLASTWSPDAPDAEALFLDGVETADFQEGYTAFLEKRPPRFED